jgi:hypothetical protein
MCEQSDRADRGHLGRSGFGPTARSNGPNRMNLAAIYPSISTMVIHAASALVAALIGAALLNSAMQAAEPAVGVVSHIKVLSDKIEDVSSLEAWRRSFIKDGMSEPEKAMAVWNSVVKFQVQDDPPSEFLQAENNVLDPIKLANVYGYSYCSVASANMQALARYAGLEARGWTIQGHVVPEIRWDGQWHLLDASLVNYFPRADGQIAGVEEIMAGVKEWLSQHPDLKGNDAKLRSFMGNGGWRNGPALLARSPFYDNNGWLPAATHGWYSTMQEYDGRTLFPYEAGYSMGYEVNIQLRRGERLTRQWSNRGLHINMNGGAAPGCLNQKVAPNTMLRYSPQYGDLAPGRIGNGIHEYDVPLIDGGFRSGALLAENLASRSEDQRGPALHAKDSVQPATLVLRMPSSYVYLSGQVNLQARVSPGGQVAISLSDNNGLDWKPVTNIVSSGEHLVDLSPLVFRRYDYQLKLVMQGPGAGLDALKITHAVQHSQRPLPALGQGRNQITFSAGSQEGTVTLEASTDLDNRGKQLVFTDFHPEMKGLRSGKILLAADAGEISFPVTTPGEMTRIRFGTCYRARDARDGWDIQISFDGGQNFIAVRRLAGPAVTAGDYTVFTNIPPGARNALVRYAGTQRNTTMISNFRISADYREPRGGFRPVQVTYHWDEDGQVKSDRHIARQPNDTYEITCAIKPVMKAIVLELAE